MNKKFRIGDLFCGYSGNTDIKKTHINGKGYPVVSSGLENTGILGFSDIDARIFPSNTITIDMFGNVFFRDFDYKMVTHARVFSLVLKDKKDHYLTTETGLYIVSMLSWLSKVFSYNNMCSYNKIANISISLPVIEHSDHHHKYTVDDIDWQYMEDRIKELEEDRIKELEAYLKATNLDDYELTDEDKKVLSLSRKSTPNENGSLETDCEDGTTIGFKKFRIGSLFDIHPTKAYKLKNRELFATIGNTPVLSNSSTNNGIGGYCGLEPTEEGKIITFSDTTTGADTMFYQTDPFIGYSHVQGMYPYNSSVWNDKRYLYLISAIRKSAGSGWSYAVKFNRALVCELMVELPVTSDGNPDFDYMERYIKAIKKLTIANVVKYKDNVIDTTKMLVNSQS